MCVAIVKPADKIITEETLRLCFKQNPDGCGFAYVNLDGNIIIYKSMDFDPFYAEYQAAIAACPQSPFLIHFRIKTHGTKDIFNCHPFQINEDMVFIHNGVINAAPACPDKRKSDTQMFNETVLQSLPEGWFDCAGIHTLIEKYIDYSKLAVLHRRNGGEIRLYNEEKGSWEDGVWFSNTLWKPRQTYHVVKKATKHLDYCLHCNKDIKGNHYADLHDISFCGWACEDAFRKKKNNHNSWKNKCDGCGKHGVTYLHVSNDHGDYEYCSAICRDSHQKRLKDQAYPQLKMVKNDVDADIVVQCVWCGEWNHNEECIPFEGFSMQTQTEFICASCVREAITAGLVTETPELTAKVNAILYPHMKKHA